MRGRPFMQPYLAFAVMLHAGLDGIDQHMDPGPPVKKNIYEMAIESGALCGSTGEPPTDCPLRLPGLTTDEDGRGLREAPIQDKFPCSERVRVLNRVCVVALDHRRA